ncbi:MAG: 16S rRNA (adenine(1518)-N(6)/adenine(1519)-N(6))-dimethyltransferase RsmA [Patescibacteria group bacterium]
MAKKGLGQHWLSDSDTLASIIAAAEISTGDTVLEIGPGLGYMTDKLLKTDAAIAVVEFDQDLLPKLRKKYDHLDKAKLEIIHDDIRTFDLSTLPSDYKIVANIPYYLTANLLRRLTDEQSKPGLAVLLVQKEVAEKVAASKKRSMLANIVQAQYQCSLGVEVPAELFQPPPKVDSQVLILKKLEKPLIPNEKWDEYVRLLKIAYANPRKKLVHNLSAGLQISKDEVRGLLESNGVDVSVRAEQLEGEEFLSTLNMLGS